VESETDAACDVEIRGVLVSCGRGAPSTVVSPTNDWVRNMESDMFNELEDRLDVSSSWSMSGNAAPPAPVAATFFKTARRLSTLDWSSRIFERALSFSLV